jgi:sortase (surface protein transpeptidase)
VAGATCLVVAVTHQRTATAVPLALPLPSPAALASATPTVGSRPGAAVALPSRLTIPALGVRSTLLTLGQAADGSLETPPRGRHYDEAGWYRYSPRPGALGPAVIVGHIDSKSGGPSVFFRLGELRPRDTIEVERADGTVAVFAVDDVRRFHKADFPTRLVYGNTDHPALRLITCGGPFDRSTGHYVDNIVVTASLVRSG